MMNSSSNKNSRRTQTSAKANPVRMQESLSGVRDRAFYYHLAHISGKMLGS